MRIKARIFGHPVHIQLVNAPLTLLFLVVPLDILAGVVHDPFWSRMAGWCLVGGLVTGAGAACFGLLDYLQIPQNHSAMPTATKHLYVMGGTLSLFIVALAIRGGIPLPMTPARVVATAAFAVAGMALMSWGGWLGGELMLRYGIGGPIQETAMSGNGHSARKRAEEIVQRPTAGVTR